MARDWVYMHKVDGWDNVEAAVSVNAEEVPQLEINRGKLREKSARARLLYAQQASLTAAKQEVTRELQQVIREGDTLVDFIRTGAREHYGKDSEKLIAFGVQPFRGRARKAVTKPPAPETTADPASIPDSVK